MHKAGEIFKTQKINEKVVRPIQVKKIDPKKIKGYDLFPNVYGNIFICAKKKSGKTSTVAKILKECIDKDTRVFVFCPTHNKDESYKKIKKNLEEKEIRNHFFESIVDEDHVDNLDMLIEELLKEENESDEESSSSEEEEEEDMVCDFSCDKKDIVVKIKKRKPLKLAQKIIFLFDDVSTELKNKNIPRLLKMNRHLKCKVIVSSQYPNDVEPGSRKQFDYWILFGGHDEAKIETIHADSGVSHDFETFKKLYKQATEKKFNFLYVDTNQNIYRKNFNEKFIL